MVFLMRLLDGLLAILINPLNLIIIGSLFILLLMILSLDGSLPVE